MYRGRGEVGSHQVVVKDCTTALVSVPISNLRAGDRSRDSLPRIGRVRRMLTSLVGSYPQPDWLLDREKLRARLPPRSVVWKRWLRTM
jgi:hypothetical protein